MSAAKRRATPTEFELEVLKVLWRLGPSTARDVLDAISARRKVGYTTVLKILQLMEEKGMVAVDRAARSHVYAPRLRKEATLGRMVREFVDRAFDGAAEEALVHLVEGGRIEDDDLDRLEALIADLRKKEDGRV